MNWIRSSLIMLGIGAFALTSYGQQRAPTTVPSKVVSVTVYRGSALVTREVQVPQTSGLTELVVTPLPPATVDSSLYSEGTDGIRILSTRYRTRAVKEDIRAEVRAKEEQIKALRDEAERLTQQIAVAQQNLALLSKLENFTTVTMQTLTDKGLLNADTTITLVKHVMDQRTAKSAELVQLQQALRNNGDAASFAQRELAERSAGSGKTERDAVIVIDKPDAAAGTIRLNYLVQGASWRPQYKFRAGTEKNPVQVEYLAAIQQASGEDWNDTSVVLSTAEPMLSAAPPELVAMDVTVGVRGAQQPGDRGGGGGFGGGGITLGAANQAQAQQLRQQAQSELNRNNYKGGNAMANGAAALEQTEELFGESKPAEVQSDRHSPADRPSVQREGPSVTYHLKPKFSLPSRNDEQLLEVTRLELSPDFFYKAVPVLSPHVYRLANLTNATEYVLLPGEATMYLGTDFVGRMALPLVAIGETFTAGFGVDPQIQVSRELAKKSRSLQGGNQVHELGYRITIASFKSAPARIQVWDRLPRAEAESVGVTLLEAKPALSADPGYVRTDRIANLLRWDLTVEPNANGEKALSIEYGFKMEYDRNVAIGNFKAVD